jgi:hypothetical protein
MNNAKLSIRAIASVTALLFATLAFAAMSGLGIAHAAEAEQPSETSDAKSADEQSETERGSDTPSSEVFIPSEDISEDFAVSFPVDI